MGFHFMFKLIHRNFRKIFSTFQLFFLFFQNFSAVLLVGINSTAYAQQVASVSDVSLSFSQESNTFSLSATVDHDLEYEILYTGGADEVQKGVRGKITSNEIATVYAGACSDSVCTPDSVSQGKLTIDQAQYEANFTIKNNQLWLMNEAKATVAHVNLNETYVAPQNDQVSVTFTQLPEEAGTLSIEEITLTDEQVLALGAYTNLAYDITSSMPDGSFEYQLRLPLPENAPETAQIVYANTTEELVSATTVQSSEIVDDIITADGLNHFTVFVVVPAAMATSFSDVYFDANLVADADNWFFYNDENDTIDNSLGSFVPGPATPPLGSSSVQLSVTGTQRKNLATYQFGGTVLSDITSLSYYTYNPSAGNGGSANRSGYLHFNVDFNGSDTWQRRLVYVPAVNGVVQQNTWQEWDAINNGNALWSYSGSTWPVDGLPGTTTKTWSQILAQYPGIRMRVSDSFLGIRVGEPYSDGYTENIDSFKFGTTSGETVFNFEIDTEGPVAPTIISPTEGQYFSATPILNDWTDVTDESGIDHYRIQYEYDDLHTFSGYPYRETTVSHRNHSPAIAEQGGVKFRVQAFDTEGNEGDWSAWRHYFYDATPPSVPVNPSHHSVTINTNNFDFDWDDSTDASPVTYEFQSSLNPAQSGGVLTTALWHSGTLPTSMIHSSGAPDGVWYWQVRAKDAAGNTSAWSEIWNVRLDTVVPTTPTVLGFLSPTVVCGGLTNSHSITVDWTDATDAVGIAGYEYSIDYPLIGGGMGNWKTFLTNSQYGGSLNEGTHHVSVRAKDVSGLFSGWSNICSVTADWTAPVTTLSSPTPGTTNQPILISGSSTDANTVESVRLSYSVAGQNDWQEITTLTNGLSQQPYMFSYEWTPALNGSYDIMAAGTDKAGNVEHSAYVYGVTYDTIAPTTPVLNTPIDGYKTKGIAFTQTWFSIPDAVSYQYQSCNSDPGDANGVCGSVKFTQTFTGVNNTTKSVGAGQPNSNFWWRVRAKDSVGNWSNWSESRQLLIDNSAPATTWDSLSSVYFNSTPLLTGVATDAYLSGIQSVSYKVQQTSDASVVHDWQAATASDGTFSDLTENFTTNLASLTDGAYTFLARSVDGAGNQSSTAEVGVIVDTIAPDVALTAPSASVISGIVPIRGTVTDENPHHYWFVIQNSSDAVVAGPGTVAESNSFTDELLLNWDTTAVSDGVYKIKLEAKDSADNKDSGSVHWLTVTVDNTDPSSIITTFDLVNGGEVETATFSGLLEGTATDATSGIDHVLLHISHLGFGEDESERQYYDATASAWTTTSSLFRATGTDTWSFQIPEEDVLEGIYTVTSHAVDVAGNVENTYSISIVYDKTIPQVSLAISPENPDGENGWYRTKPTVTLTQTDNYETDYIEYQWNLTADGGWITYTGPIQPPSEGQSVLYYRAVDLVGNVSDTGIKAIKYDATAPAEGPLSVRVENVSGTTADGRWDKPANDSGIVKYIVIWRHTTDGKEYSAEVGTGPNSFQKVLTNLYDGTWEFIVRAQDDAGNYRAGSVDFIVGGSSPGTVAGSETQTVSTLPSVLGLQTQQVNQNTQDDEQEQKSQQDSDTQSQGEVAGVTDSTCTSWKYYLPVFLLLIQLLFALSFEIANRESALKKMLYSLVISGLLIGSFYLLRDTNCFGEPGIFSILATWFVPFSLGLGIIMRALGSFFLQD